MARSLDRPTRSKPNSGLSPVRCVVVGARMLFDAAGGSLRNATVPEL
jgi:hypothetical protein